MHFVHVALCRTLSPKGSRVRPNFSTEYKKAQQKAGRFCIRAGKGTRTLDPDLGKVVLYQLSYFRVGNAKVMLFFEPANFLTNFLMILFSRRICRCNDSKK